MTTTPVDLESLRRPESATTDQWIDWTVHVVESLPVFVAELTELRKENAILRVKASGTLANNLCPDHRDKQIGKRCLACEIDERRARDAKVAELVEAAASLFDQPLRYRDLRIEIYCDSHSDAMQRVRRLRAALAAFKEPTP